VNFDHLGFFGFFTDRYVKKRKQKQLLLKIDENGQPQPSAAEI
jgi:hypothetical protein